MGGQHFLGKSERVGGRKNIPTGIGHRERVLEDNVLIGDEGARRERLKQGRVARCQREPV